MLKVEGLVPAKSGLEWFNSSKIFIRERFYATSIFGTIEVNILGSCMRHVKQLHEVEVRIHMHPPSIRDIQSVLVLM